MNLMESDQKRDFRRQLIKSSKLQVLLLEYDPIQFISKSFKILELHHMRQPKQLEQQDHHQFTLN